MEAAQRRGGAGQRLRLDAGHLRRVAGELSAAVFVALDIASSST
jgi:hypothetical protein